MLCLAARRQFNVHIAFNGSLSINLCKIDLSHCPFQKDGYHHKLITNHVTTEAQICLQVYFLDLDYKATLRANFYVSDDLTSDPMMSQSFNNLHCPYLRSQQCIHLSTFLAFVEWICLSGHHCEKVYIELHETEQPLGGQHPGYYHVLTAPEVSILLPSMELMPTSKSMILCSVRTS